MLSRFQSDEFKQQVDLVKEAAEFLLVNQIQAFVSLINITHIVSNCEWKVLRGFVVVAGERLPRTQLVSC